jgi:hypothetical protein
LANVFQPGHKAPLSGIYKAVHANSHAEPHYICVLYGERFPSCLGCSGLVRFEIVISAIHVNAHPLFARDS